MFAMALFTKLALVLFVKYLASHEANRVAAEAHHVVGGDRGWDASSDFDSWLAGRVFRVGDKIWFAYSAAEGRIVEVKSLDEYLACDTSNPIRMYTDGLESITLDTEGVRYFTSSKSESCKNGLKLNVEVMPQHIPAADTTDTEINAAAPSSSAATYLLPPASLSFLVGCAIYLCVGLLAF